GSNPGSVVVARVDVDTRDAFGAEHLEVPAVVLEGEAEVEAIVAEVAHGVALELPGHGVVAEVAHDQQVPAQVVALEPGERLGLYPQGPAGQQNHGELVVEEVHE